MVVGTELVELLVEVVGSGVEVVSGGGDVDVRFLVVVVVGGTQVVVGGSHVVVGSGFLEVVLGGSGFLVVGSGSAPSLKVHVIWKTPASVLANCSNKDCDRSSEP